MKHELMFSIKWDHHVFIILIKIKDNKQIMNYFFLYTEHFRQLDELRSDRYTCIIFSFSDI